VGQAILPAPF